MPGQYAQVMRQERLIGRYPDFLLTLMLFRNTMHENFTQGDHAINYMTYVLGWNTLPSCHPMALRFMNMVSDINLLVGGDDFAPSTETRGAGAGLCATAGAAAIVQDDKAVWVTYGHIAGHSFVLIASDEDDVESFEGWAGGAVDDMGGGVTPNAFHTSVLDRADEKRPTKPEARDALRDLVAPALATRGAAADRLSRAGYGGFDHESIDDDGTVVANIVPSLEIRVANLRALAVFRNDVRTRLREVGYYRQRMIEAHFNNDRVVCCHCQAGSLGGIVRRRQAGNWRECPNCNRHFCRTCKGLLAGHAHRWVRRPGKILPSFEHGQRTCDGCATQTTLL